MSRTKMAGRLRLELRSLVLETSILATELPTRRTTVTNPTRDLYHLSSVFSYSSSTVGSESSLIAAYCSGVLRARTVSRQSTQPASYSMHAVGFSMVPCTEQ